MKKDSLRTLLVGLFFAAALAILTISVLMLRPRFGDGGLLLRARFANVEKINEGTRVTFAGKPVGQVSKLYPLKDARASNKDGLIFAFEVVLSLDSNLELYSTDTIQPQTSGLLGERTIAIIPKLLANTLAGSSQMSLCTLTAPPSVENTVETLSRLAAKSEGLVGHIDALLSRTGAEVSHSLHKIAEASDGWNHFVQRLGNQQLLDNFSQAFAHTGQVMQGLDKLLKSCDYEKIACDTQALLGHLRSFSAQLDQPARLHQLLDQSQATLYQICSLGMRLNQSWPKIEQGISGFARCADSVQRVSANLDSAAQQFASISHQIQSGQGSLGKLVMSDELYQSALQSVDRANLLVSDINNYGLLFHKNRAWKRQRAAAFDTTGLQQPQSFQRFWGLHLQAVQLQLHQLSSILTRAGQKQAKVDPERFEPLVAALLTQLHGLQRQLGELSTSLPAK